MIEVHGCLWQRAFGLCSGFAEVATDGFDAASVLRGKLCGALLAFAVALPKGVGVIVKSLIKSNESKEPKQ